MKKLLFILFLSNTFCAFSQTDTGNITQIHDSIIKPAEPAAAKKQVKQIVLDTIKKQIITDTSKKADSIVKTDSVVRALSDTAKASYTDTIKKSNVSVNTNKSVDSFYTTLSNNPFITKAKPIYLVANEREEVYKDEAFYLLCGLLLFLAFIRLVFNRYFKNIFRLFFQPSFRQKQTREQLLQNNLPSLFLNLFFIFSAGTYITFLLQYYHRTNLAFWLLLLYANGVLLALYLGKFIFLTFTGWVFDVKEATQGYIFAVYMVNKIIGVVLIPFTLLIAFSQPSVINISITFSLLLILFLYLYRYLVSYAPIRKEVKVSVLHFFFYICAFEIIPLLLIYKTLIIFLDNSH